MGEVKVPTTLSFILFPFSSSWLSLPLPTLVLPDVENLATLIYPFLSHPAVVQRVPSSFSAPFFVQAAPYTPRSSFALLHMR